MAYKYGDRNQIMLLPPCIDDYVGGDAPVRAYDAIIEALDFQELGIEVKENKVGNSSYDPVTMLKLLTYSYSYGIKSSRKIERACHDNLSFTWLMGGLKPDHKTISEFRRKNIGTLKNILKQTVRICLKLNLVDGNVLFVDGSKFRGNANRDNNHSETWCKEKLEALDQRIEELLVECEKQDKNEIDEASYVKMNKELAQKERLKKKIEFALSELKRKKVKKINITDPDSVVMKSRQGSHSSYNIQSVVDEKEGLIVHANAIVDNNDFAQFDGQIREAMNNTGQKCKVACADSGYCNLETLKEIDNDGICVVVPSARQVTWHKPKPFEKNEFKYDQQNNCYFCAEGYRLKYCGRNIKRQIDNYKIEDPQLCITCSHYGRCTKSKKGRSIQRYWNESEKERFENQYIEFQDIYSKRKQKVELPFGHIKNNLGYGQFLLRGIEKVQGEISLLASCFNIRRLIGIFSVKGLIKRIMEFLPLLYA